MILPGNYIGYSLLVIYNYYKPGAYPRGGEFGACAPPLEPNAQRKKSMEIKRLEGTDSAKIAKIVNMIFFFLLKILLSLLFNLG